MNPLLWELWPFFTFKRCFPSDIFFKNIDLSLFSTPIFAKYLRVIEDGPGRGHLCHTDIFLVLFLFKNIDCGYSLELPHRGSSNEYPQSMF